ncbi:MAG TPA: LLM class flavin-dependent oxidoreductase [Geobacterales bacterium]|nr:LLM class flavin-dependent oxidoreductase [Geobacterales bacterium]
MDPLFALNIDPYSAYIDDEIKIAKIADEHGIDIISMQDHPYNGNFLDTWTFLTYLASITEKVRIMTNVANTPLRNPVMLAKQASTLDRITKGRVELGIGAGAFWDGIRSFGLEKKDPKEAFEAFKDAINIMRIFFSITRDNELASYEGKYYSLYSAYLGPKPYHKIRIWIGGYGKKMLALIGMYGDGWTISLPYLPPQELPSKKKIIEEYALKKGRDPKNIRTNYNFGGIIFSDEKERERIKRADVIMGTIDEWVKIMLEFHKLGVDTFTFWAAGPRKVEQSILFAKEVVPRFKESLGYK